MASVAIGSAEIHHMKHTIRSDDGIRETTLADTIHALAGLGIDQLRKEWRTRLGTAPPPFRSADTVGRLLAWQLQERLFGGLDDETAKLLSNARRLVREGRNPVPQTQLPLSPGAVLVREWRGTIHRVQVTTSGFEHEGKRYRTLSQVAGAITGTSWSGPRFFGLEPKTEQPAQKTP
jgi:hypothetical protein